MSYNFEKTTTDIDVLERCYNQLKNEQLKKIAGVANENLTNIVVGLALPHFLMTENIKSLKHIEYTIKAATEFKGPLEPTTEEEKRKRNEYIKKRFQEDSRIFSEEARRQLSSLRQNIPDIENAIRSQALNSLVNVWTVFESTAKDIWVYLLNYHQDKFLTSILECKGNEETEGIFGKNISIGFLGKHGFNINNKLGIILSPKYDFTSCNGIKKAFVDLDKKKKNNLEFLSNKDLLDLEITRNLIVHKAGLVDEFFIERIFQSNQSVGDKIDINVETYSKYENAMIKSLVSLLNYSETMI